MWRLILLISAAVGCFETSSYSRGKSNEIIGGVEVTIDKIPYQLELEKNEKFDCGASIIDEYWALTAAHCVMKHQPNEIRLRSGSSIKEQGGELHQVVEIISHASYAENPQTGDDVAVMRVNTPFNKTHIISLAKVRPETGTNITVSGWGITSLNPFQSPNHLHWVIIPIFDQAQCVALNAPSINVTGRMICAGLPEGGKDSCIGDSGGPLAVGNTQVGIVSKGALCATKRPGVNVDVAALSPWILEKIGKGKE